MKYYLSTAGCGYNEYAIVTPIFKNKKGSDYLCIWTNESPDMPIHTEGEIIEDLESIYLKEIEIDINEFPISRTFLFKYFIRNFNFENNKVKFI